MVENKKDIDELEKNIEKKNDSNKKDYELEYLDWFFDKGWLRVKKTDF